MIALRFEHPAQGEVVTLGPVPYFRISGNSLLAGPEDTEVGFYENGAWHLAGKTFVSAVSESPAQIRFEEEGEPCGAVHGPFDCLKLVDGAIRHGPSYHALLAKLDEISHLWYIYPEQKECPVAVLCQV